MRNLFAFLFRFRGALVFGLLEVLSLALLVTNSSYQRAAFFNSANEYAGTILARRQQVTDYFRLAEINQQLLAENAALRQQLYPAELAGREADSIPIGLDTLRRVVFQKSVPRPAPVVAPARPPDSLLLGGRLFPARDTDFPLIPARVINQSLRQVDNYLTLNVGAADGVRPGLGVVSAAGVVGRVQVVTEHFATATSLLHSKMAVSARLRRDGTEGAISWPGDDPTHVLLNYIPRQNRLVLGDSVVTSGYNAIFPSGIFIGAVDYFVKEADKNFWTVRVRLATDFTKLTHVYVVMPERQAERDSVEARARRAAPPAPLPPPGKITRPTSRP